MLRAIHRARAQFWPLGRPSARRSLKVLAADPVDRACAKAFLDRGIKLVESPKSLTQAELVAAIPAYEGLVVRSGVKVTAEVFKAGKKLRVVGRAGAGTDNIDLVAASAAGVVAMNTPGGNTSAAAELTLSLILALARQLPAAVSSLKAGAWERGKFGAGMELKGKTIGVVGLGMIGSEVARRCLALDMHVIGFDPSVSAERAAALGVAKVPLDDLLSRSDIISLHVPKTADTTHLIRAATLAKCKDGVRIVNVARGGIVHEGDLLAALNSGKVAGAALDVFETEPPGAAAAALLAHPRLLCTPHLGASTEEAQVKVAREIAEQMADAFAGTAFVGVVNAPHLALAGSAALAPYARLTEALGSLAGQMWAAGAPRTASVNIDLAGPAFAAAPPAALAALVKAALLKGLLPAVAALDYDAAAVNLINAPALAAREQLAVAVRAAPAAAPAAAAYASTVAVTVRGAAGQPERAFVGAVVDGEPRIVGIDEWATPSFPTCGSVLLFNNADSPGVVSRVTSVLADNNINIATLSVVRQAKGEPALSIIISDQRLPKDVELKVCAEAGITGVRTATFATALG